MIGRHVPLRRAGPGPTITLPRPAPDAARIAPMKTAHAPARLAFVTPALGRTGGMGVSADRITRGLAGHGDRLAVTVLEPDPLLPWERFEDRGTDEQGRRRIGFWTTGGAQGGQLLADVIEHLGPTHVAAFGATHLAQAAVFAARLGGVPSFVLCRGNDVDLGAFSRDGVLHWTLGRADAVFAVTREMARKIEVLSPAARIHVVPNSVDTAAFTPGPPPPDGRLRVALFGEIKAKKGLAFLLEALDLERTTLAIHGTLRDDSRKLLHGLFTLRPEAAGSVEVHPWEDDPAALAAAYRAAHVVAFPSVHDGLPNALLEAMACGRPCVATAVGGAKDLLVDGTNGYLCTPRDVGSLAAALARAAGAVPGERARVGAAARRTVIERCAPGAETAAYLAHMGL